MMSSVRIKIVLITILSCTFLISNLEAADSKNAQFAGQGCAGGAILGGVLAKVLGKDSKRVRNAALIGCGAGVAYGLHIAKRTNKYISANQAIDSEIALNRKNTVVLQKYNAGLARKINSYRQQIHQIKRKQVAAAVKQKQLRSSKRTVSKELADSKAALVKMNNEIRTARKQYNAYSKNIKVPAKRVDWQRKLLALEKSRNILNHHVKTLNALNASI